MSTTIDIIHRLNALANCEHDDVSIGYEAAEEIIALREQLAAAQADITRQVATMSEQATEIEALRTQLATPAVHTHTPDCFAHGCAYAEDDQSLPEAVCEAYGWLFHITSDDKRVHYARKLLLSAMTKDQQKAGIRLAKDNGATVQRMATR